MSFKIKMMSPDDGGVLGGGNAPSGNNGGANGGGSGSGGSGGGGTGNSGGNSGGGGGVPSWRDSLPEEIRADPSLSPIQDVATLAKGYIHAQSLMGKKGHILPTSKSAPEEWQSLFKALGQPELDKFEVKLGEGQKMPDETMKAFKETAHKLGLLPNQAQGLFDWFSQAEKSQVANTIKTRTTQQTEALNGLKKEWGPAYDREVAVARLAVTELGGEDFQKYLREAGLSSDPNMIRFMAKAGKLLGEDKLRGIGEGPMGSQTPAQIQAEIDKVQGDLKHPYFDRSHASHGAAVSHMENLWKQLALAQQRNSA